MTPPILRAQATGNTGEVQVDIMVPTPYKVRLYLYTDTPVSAVDPSMWPVLLAAGQHTLTGLPDGETIGIYGVIESEVDGSILSYPSNLVKVVPYASSSLSITVEREAIEPYTAYDVDAYRLRIDVTAATGVSKAIFMHRKEPADESTTPLLNSFVSVCTPSDLQQFPSDEPLPEGNLPGEPPFYRLSYIDVVDDSLARVMEIWHTIQSAVLGLEDQLRKIEQVTRYTRVVLDSGMTGEPSLSSVSLSMSSEAAVSSSSASALVVSSSLSSNSSSSVA